MESLNTKLIRGLGTPPASAASIISTPSPRKEAGYHPYKRGQGVGGWFSPRRPRTLTEGRTSTALDSLFFWSGSSSMANSLNGLGSSTSRAFTSSRAGASGFLSRRSMKFQYRMLVLLYVALGCVIPYYVMKYAEQERWVDEQYQRQQEQEQQEGQQRRQPFPVVPVVDLPAPTEPYKRQAFFQDVALDQLLGWPSPSSSSSIVPSQVRRRPSFQSRQHRQPQEAVSAAGWAGSTTMDQHIRELEQLRQSYQSVRALSGLSPQIQTAQEYERVLAANANATQVWIERQMATAPLTAGLSDRIVGTAINSGDATRRFRQLMDAALDAGHWVYEADRDYPDFGGATGWNKKKKTERDRDPAIDRAPFPEAGKYHWEPEALRGQDWRVRMRLNADGDEKKMATMNEASWNNVGWYSSRVQPGEFCRLLGTRHLMLVGDMIHWQLHDAILYNMFDNPQACYGDLACHLGVGHPLCPLPNDVRMKFVRNDLLSTLRPKMSRLNETKTQNPVEMPWLKDLKLKDTVILGASHFHPFSDTDFIKKLTETLTKIRKTRPNTLIIYRNQHLGHPNCPSKANNFNIDHNHDHNHEHHHEHSSLTHHSQVPLSPSSPSPQEQALRRLFDLQQSLLDVQATDLGPTNKKKKKFRPAAQPLSQAIAVEELLHYPLDWVHYERQNQMARMLVEAAGGIYWNVATMTNLRPDGHQGDQDCLLYKRPGPTDEWAVSLYNLFKTIEQVELEFSASRQ